VIHRAPGIIHLAVDLHEDLVQVPAPLRHGPQTLHTPPSDLGGEHGAEPVPP
jgi:hypothetical protein